MGLGKTIQSAMMLQYMYKICKIRGPFLIIAPLSTMENWKRELELWTDLNCFIYHGTQESRDITKKKEFYIPGNAHWNLW